jgi:hypothetical protein
MLLFKTLLSHYSVDCCHGAIQLCIQAFMHGEACASTFDQENQVFGWLSMHLTKRSSTEYREPTSTYGPDECDQAPGHYKQQVSWTDWRARSTWRHGKAKGQSHFRLPTLIAPNSKSLRRSRPSSEIWLGLCCGTQVRVLGVLHSSQQTQGSVTAIHITSTITQFSTRGQYPWFTMEGHHSKKSIRGETQTKPSAGTLTGCATARHI